MRPEASGIWVQIDMGYEFLIITVFNYLCTKQSDEMQELLLNRADQAERVYDHYISTTVIALDTQLPTVPI